MSETKPIYDSAAAPAPAATCPTLRQALEKIRTLTGGGCYDCMVAEGKLCDRCLTIRATVEAALATPDPLTALERAALEAAKEYDLAMEMFAIAHADGDRETRLVARENVTETKRAFRRAMATLARAAAGTGT